MSSVSVDQDRIRSRTLPLKKDICIELKKLNPVKSCFLQGTFSEKSLGINKIWPKILMATQNNERRSQPGEPQT